MDMCVCALILVKMYICVYFNGCINVFVYAVDLTWDFVARFPLYMCAYTFLSIYRIICVYICIHDELHEFH